jgi:hypothetical protein
LTPKNRTEIKRTPDAATGVTLDPEWNRYSRPLPDKMREQDYAYDASTPTWQ